MVILEDLKKLTRKWKKTSLEELAKRKSYKKERKMLLDKLKRLDKNKKITDFNKKLIREYVFNYRAHHGFSHQAYILERLMKIARFLNKDFDKIATKDKDSVLKFIEEKVKLTSKNFFIEDFEDFLDWLKQEKNFKSII